MKEQNLKPRAKVLATALVGTDPTIMLTGPAPAARKALEKLALRLMILTYLKLMKHSRQLLCVLLMSSTFLLKSQRKWRCDCFRPSVRATGAMILGTLLDELERQDKKRGLATLCVGGGMGIATIIERV